ncbi:MAG: MoxR family ATPase, partial [Cystobacter sp.]
MNSPARATPTPSTPATARATLEQVATNLSLAVRGKDKEVRLAVTCVAAGGHLLLEDVPGVGKTTLVEAIGRSFALSLSRVQFTADLMPADILGAQI